MVRSVCVGGGGRGVCILTLQLPPPFFYQSHFFCPFTHNPPPSPHPSPTSFPTNPLRVPPGGDPSRGLADAAYAALNTVEFPGYGFMLANGAVALWEHLDTLWDHSSRNHAWYGSVAVFLRRVMGGIGPAPGARGFDRVLIKPIPQRLAAAGGGAPPPPRYANTSYESTRGPVTTQWRLSQVGATTTFTVRVLLPPNVATTVELPLAPPIEGGAVHRGGSGRGEVVAAWDNPPSFESSCTWLPPPVLDTVRGVARWEFSGFTDCTFSAIWG